MSKNEDILGKVREVLEEAQRKAEEAKAVKPSATESTPAPAVETYMDEPETTTPEPETHPKEVVEGEVGDEVEAGIKLSKPDKKAKERAMGKVADATGETSGVDFRTGRRAESRNEAFARAEAEREASSRTGEISMEEIADLPEKERAEMQLGLANIGFWVDKKKNDFWAWTFGNLVTEEKGKGTSARFFKELRDSFKNDAKESERKAKEAKSGKNKRKIENASKLFGNLVRYGRTLSDVTGVSLASPLRYVMMAGMGVTRVFGAGKEARFQNEELKNKTRIENAENAYDEAIKIYEKAGGKYGEDSLSAEKLHQAYLENIPVDLQERLKKPSEANHLVQKILGWDVKRSVAKLNGKIAKIEENGKLPKEKKEEKKQKLLKSWEKDLKDYDRMLTQYGTVDGLAMGARYMQTAGKAIVAGVTVETILQLADKMIDVDKLWKNVSEFVTRDNDTAVSQIEAVKLPGTEVNQGAKNLGAVMPDTVTGIDTTATTDSVRTDTLSKTIPDSSNTDSLTKAPGLTQTPGSTATSPVLEKPDITAGTPEATHTTNLPPLDEKAIIGKGEGIEHAFRRQIESDLDLAKKLGYTGEPGDAKALRAFSGNAAHQLAKEHGYVEGLKEVRIRGGGGDVAYQLEMDKDGNIKVLERYVKDGELGEDIHGSREGLEKDLESYEYHDTNKVSTGSNRSGVRAEDLERAEELKQRVIGKIDRPDLAETNDVDPTHGSGKVTAPKTGPVVTPEDTIPTQTEVAPNPAQRFPNQPEGFKRFTGIPPEPGSAEYNDPNIRAQMARIYEQPPARRFGNWGWFNQQEPARPMYPEMASQALEGGFTPDQIKLMEMVHETNLEKVFPENMETMWDAVKSQPVKNMLDPKLEDVGEKFRPFAMYLRKLQAETGVIPKGRSWFGLGKSETSAEYIKRAVEAATRMGKIENIKVPKV